MHAPQEAIESLERLHPYARLGWVGVERSDDDDRINRGEFALLQLYRKRDFDGSYFLPWDGRGPVYGTRYDPNERFPVWLASFSPEEVFSGAFIVKVRRWMTSIYERVRQSQIERGKAVESQVQDLTGAAGDHLWWQHNKSNDVGNITARKFIPKEEQAIAAGDAPKKDFSEKFITDVPKGVKVG